MDTDDVKVYSLINGVLKLNNVYDENATWYEKLQTVSNVAPSLRNAVDKIENSYIEDMVPLASVTEDIQEYMNIQTGLKNYVKLQDYGIKIP